MQSLRTRLGFFTVALAFLPLLTLGIVVSFTSYQSQKNQAIALQRQVSLRAASEAREIFGQLEQRIRSFVELTGFPGRYTADKHDFLLNLLFLRGREANIALDEVSFINNEAFEEARLSRMEIFADQTRNLQGDPFVVHGLASSTSVLEPPFSQSVTGEMLSRFMVPFHDKRSDELVGAILINIRLGRIWEDLLREGFSKTGQLYICDGEGRVVAHPNSSYVYMGKKVPLSSQKNLVSGLDGEKVIRTITPFELFGVHFFLLADWSTSEALKLTYDNLATMAFWTLICMIVAIGVATNLLQRIVDPLLQLAQTARSIDDGDLSQRALEGGDLELDDLAKAFNKMTSRLITDIEQRKKAEKELLYMQSILEVKVDERTKDLTESNLQLTGEIEQRKKTERELRESELKFRELFNQVADYVLILDVEEPNVGKIVDANEAAFAMHGYQRHEFIGRSVLEINPALGSRDMREIVGQLLSRGTLLFETIHQRKDGSTFPVEVAAKPVTISNHRYIIAVERDVTERKKAEEALQEAHDQLERKVDQRTEELRCTNLSLQRQIEERQKMEKEREAIQVKALAQSKLASLGEIATGIAHEINQPLSFIRVVFDATLRDIEEDAVNFEELREDFDESLRQIGRISAIVDHLRVFGRNDIAQKEEVNIRLSLDHALVLMRERLRLQNIALTIQQEDELPLVFGNAVQLEEVFINLIQNAIDALAGQAKAEIKIFFHMEGQHLMIEFVDNGPGITAENCEKIFEPFFTTKEPGKGTGIGLSLVYGIISEHNGTIECSSEIGQYTRFIITLPIASSEEE